MCLAFTVGPDFRFLDRGTLFVHPVPLVYCMKGYGRIVLIIAGLMVCSVVNVSAQRESKTSSARAAYGGYEIISPIKHKAKKNSKQQKQKRKKTKRDKTVKIKREKVTPKNDPYRRRSGWAG